MFLYFAPKPLLRNSIKFKDKYVDVLHSVLSIGALHELALTCFFSKFNPSFTVALQPFAPNILTNLIDKYIPSPFNSQLKDLALLFINSNILEFYTDGSLINLGSP